MKRMSFPRCTLPRGAGPCTNKKEEETMLALIVRVTMELEREAKRGPPTIAGTMWREQAALTSGSVEGEPE